MATDPNAARSRRALLTAAAGGAAAVAAAAAMPLTALAVDDDPVLVGHAHTGATETSITTTSANPDTDPQVAFKAHSVNADHAGLLGSAGDETNIGTEFTAFTGVYGWSVTAGSDTSFGTGVWGDSDDVGTYGTGAIGVRGDGGIGVVAAGAAGGGTGLRAWGGDGTGNDVALDVRGKVLFSRSGKSTISAGAASRKVNLTGVTAGSRVFAVLHSNRSGRYVRAVVPTTGSFTIYLNTSVTAATYVAWFVLN